MTDLQQQEANLKQLQAEKPRTLRQSLRAQRNDYVKNLQMQQRSLQQDEQHWEQTKQELRNSLKAKKSELKQKLQPLNWPSEQLIAQRMTSYNDEWKSAEQHIETQKQFLQQAETSYPTDLQQHKDTLRTAFEKLEKNLTESQQQNAQCKSGLPALVATWKTAANERETSLQAELSTWQARHPTSTEVVPSWPELSAKAQQLTERQQSLSARSYQLLLLQQRLSSAEQTMQAEWQRVSRKPCFSAPPSSEQRTDWLKKSRPLKELLSELRQLTTRCAMLKAELLTFDFLGADDFPEIDVAWAEGN